MSETKKASDEISSSEEGGTPVKPAERKRPARETSIDKGTPIRRVMDAMISEGVIPQGAHWHKESPSKPISMGEAYAQLRALKQVDFDTVTRVLLQWKSGRFLNAHILEGIVRLINEQRIASVPDILKTIHSNPSDGGELIGSNGGQTVDEIQCEMSGGISSLISGSRIREE